MYNLIDVAVVKVMLIFVTFMCMVFHNQSGAKHLTLARLYSGTPLPMSKKSLAILTGWPYYWGRLKFHDSRAL